MKIISVFTNSPVWIDLQYRSIRKYFKCTENFEYIIFNDAKDWPDFTNFEDSTMRESISNICELLGIKCIDIPNEHHKFNQAPSSRHADSLTFMKTYMENNPDKYLVLDSDMFFVDYFDINKFDSYYFCYINQVRSDIHYPWANFFYIDYKSIPNSHMIDWNVGNGLDTGGSCYKWLLTLDPSKIYKMSHLQSCNWNSLKLPETIDKKLLNFLEKDERNINNNYFSELYIDKILHYRAVSNWMNIGCYDIQIKMISLLEDTLNLILL